MASKGSNEVGDFKGSYDFTIDSKGRVSLPKPFRDLLVELNEQVDNESSEVKVVVTKDSSQNTLVFFPVPVWEELTAELKGKSYFERKKDKELQAFIELYVYNARDLVLDSNGRFTLPKDFRDYLGEDGKDEDGNKIIHPIKEVTWTGAIDTMQLRPTAVFNKEQEELLRKV